MIDIVPPNNINIEHTILASMMTGKEEISEYASDKLTPEDFYNTENKIIFKCMQDMSRSSVGAMDTVLVQDALFSSGNMDFDTAMAMILKISETQSVASIEEHCRRLKELTAQREYLMLSYKMQEFIKKGEQSAKISDQINNTIMGMERSDMPVTTHIKESINETMDMIQSNTPEYDPVYYGYEDVDRISGGMFPGELIIIGARPGMGKSAFSLDVILNNALRSKKALVFTMEMTKPQLVSRYVSRIGSVSNTKIRHKMIGKSEFPNIQKAFEVINGLPIYLNDAGELSAHQIRAEAKRFKRKHSDLKFIVIDYLQLMEESVGGDSGTRLSVNLNCKVLRILAKELGIAVIALSQLNRKCEERKNPHKRPILSDLKESGNIEQDASQIIFLYRGFKYDEVIDDIPVKENELEVIFAKVREGSPDTARLNFEGDTYSFTGVEERRQEPFGVDADIDSFVMGIGD